MRSNWRCSLSVESTIRGAYLADLDAIIALTDAAYAKYIPRIGRKPQPMIADYRPMIDASQVWLATVMNVVVGLIVLQPQADHLLIYSIAVAPTHVGQGIGRALLVWAETETCRQGFTKLQLYTNEKMTENLALYQRIGYVEYQRAAYKGFQLVYMSKTLCQPEGGEEMGQADE